MKYLLLLISLVISAKGFAKSEVLSVTDHGFVVKNQFFSTVDKKQLWHHLVQDIDKWWPKDHTWWGEKSRLSLSANAGGCFCEYAGNNSAEHMRISFVEEQTLLRMTGGLGPLQGMGMYGALDWAFSNNNGQTQVTLTYKVHGIYPDGKAELAKLADIVGKVQGMQLQALKTFAEAQSQDE